MEDDDLGFDPGYSQPGSWGRAHLSPPLGWTGVDSISGDIRLRPDTGGAVTLPADASLEEVNQTVTGYTNPGDDNKDADNTVWWIVGGVGVAAALGIGVAIAAASKPKRRRRR